MKPSYWMKWGAIAGITVMLTSGCSLLGSNEIDPPQDETVVAGTNGDALSVSAAVQGLTQGVTMYLKDRNGFIAPVTLNLPRAEGIAKLTLESMVVDGVSKGQLPKDFTAVLPKGTQVKGIDIKEKTAIVDFTKEFKSYAQQDERKLMEAITWTLTGFAGVDNVELRIDGVALKQMPVGGTPIDGKLSRAMGINIERADGVEFGQSTPVTLYFQSETTDKTKYYVPVTRLVKRTDDKATAVIEQLIVGPTVKSKLHSVLAPTLELPKLELGADGVMNVNFTDKLLGTDKKAPGESIQSVILSLTENAVSKVQIKVNGNTAVQATDNQNYSKPVAKPSSVNPIKM
ncbi:GerMN domain-containing protein [Paenibacillus koleovorans]|uniref:GerMN domain-containing protein n=1 Tax=Paenibacillus koleovorans TaxID=121608 RepID=UPI000FDC7824|nr:GerMN domain-containing protein [Paenibacillus koleovorans]